MPISAGTTDITIVDLSSWKAIVVVFMVCGTRVVVAAMRSDGPLMRAAAAAFWDWFRRRRHDQ